MNLNIIKQVKGPFGITLVNQQETNVARFKFTFVDTDEETDIPCVTIWYYNSKNPSNGDFTFTHVVSVESF